MQKNHNVGSYGFAAYDRYMSLRPPLLLWIAVLYLSRAIVLPLVAQLVSCTGSTTDATSMMHDQFTPLVLVPSFFAIVVLWVLLAKSPSRGPLMRRIYARGRTLLALSALCDLVVHVVGPALWGGELPEQTLGTLLVGLFDGYFLVFVLVSRQVRDVFASFPPASVD